MEDLRAAIAAVESGSRTTPLVGQTERDGSATVTFLAKRDRNVAPRIVSDVTGWGESIDGDFDFNSGAMHPVGQSDWYFLEAKVAARARIEYLVAYGQSDYRPDPFNPRRSEGPQMGGPPASEFVMPGYHPPPEFTDPRVSLAGSLVETTLTSRTLHRPCSLTVYTPPGYAGGRGRTFPLAVFSDLGPRHVPRVLDWLIAHREIEPIVAVFALPDSKGRDLPGRDEMKAFLTGELPGWVAARYAVSNAADERAVLAVSFGARDALHAALSTPGNYGGLALLIPGRRISTEDIASISRHPDRLLHVAILAGQYDRANVPTARSVRQALDAAGHRVDYFEVPEGHSPVTFHHHLREVLVSLFPPRGSARLFSLPLLTLEDATS